MPQPRCNCARDPVELDSASHLCSRHRHDVHAQKRQLSPPPSISKDTLRTCVIAIAIVLNGEASVLPIQITAEVRRAHLPGKMAWDVDASVHRRPGQSVASQPKRQAEQQNKHRLHGRRGAVDHAARGTYGPGPPAISGDTRRHPAQSGGVARRLPVDKAPRVVRAQTIRAAQLTAKAYQRDKVKRSGCLCKAELRCPHVDVTAGTELVKRPAWQRRSPHVALRSRKNASRRGARHK